MKMSYQCSTCGSQHLTERMLIACQRANPEKAKAAGPLQLSIPIDTKLQAKIARHNELMEKPMTATSAEDFAELTGLFHSIALTLFHTTMAELNNQHLAGKAHADSG